MRERLHLLAHPEVIAGGEQVKHDPELVTRLQRRLVELGIDRHCYVVAIGGGAFLDMVGFVAATTHRGVRHVRVPTTVLGQNDSGVGVKNGVNAFGVKNLLGTFAPPFAVLNDSSFLRTLHPRDRIAGIAEAVKVALIRDRVFFEWLEAQVDALRACAPEATARMIRRCAELHMRQIAHGGDPFETGSARPLDYGHWSAHKLEALTRTSCGTARRSPSAWRSTAATRCRSACSPPGGKSASRAAQAAWLLPVASGAGAPRRRWPLADSGRTARIPRASGRRAHHHAAARDRPRRGSACDG